jgi:hypothetical protein
MLKMLFFCDNYTTNVAAIKLQSSSMARLFNEYRDGVKKSL